MKNERNIEREQIPSKLYKLMSTRLKPGLAAHTNNKVLIALDKSCGKRHDLPCGDTTAAA